MTQTAQGLLGMIEARGWKGRMISIDRLVDLKEAIDGRYRSGLLDGGLYKEFLSDFQFELPEELQNARSILVIAVPVPQTRIIFHWKGERLPVVVPPTYVEYSPRNEGVRAILAACLERYGYWVGKLHLPLKTLAVCSGLAEYGRNNICYVTGMGSFFQLVGALSDLPCDEDHWREPTLLERCLSCKACRQSCPTGAITEDRFLLHAERCLTYHNEGAGEFAAWIDPSWHHCLIGCMRCQSSCPENMNALERFEDRAEFSDEETVLLNNRVPFDRLAPETRAKLQELQINEDYQLLCRNLSMLIDQAICGV